MSSFGSWRFHLALEERDSHGVDAFLIEDRPQISDAAEECRPKGDEERGQRIPVDHGIDFIQYFPCPSLS